MKISTFCVALHFLWLPAFPAGFFLLSFDLRHHRDARHKTLFCHNLYFTGILQYIFHHSLWRFCAHVCGIELRYQNIYRLQNREHHSHWIYVSFSVCLNSVLRIFFSLVGCVAQYLISFRFFSYRITYYNLSVQMRRRYIWINEFTSITFFN